MKQQESKIKVAFLHQYLKLGGSETISLNVAKEFTKLGIESIFITHKYSREEFIIPADVKGRVEVLPEKKDISTKVNIAYLYDFIKKEDIKIVFLVYINFNFFEEFDFSQTNCKFVYWNHNEPFWEYYYLIELGKFRTKYSIKNWIKWHLLGEKNKILVSKESLKERERKIIDTVDKYIVLHPEYKKILEEELLLSEDMSSKLIPILNTFDNHIPIERKKERKKEIVYVGRIDIVQKRFDRLLKIWDMVQEELPDWTLKLYGSGNDEWILEKMMKNKKNVQYCGPKTREEIFSIYESASILCVTSSYEGWLMVLTEGQSRGCVPILFNTYAVAPYLVDNNECGRLIEPYDFEGYAKALVELCKNDELRQELSKKCIEKSLSYKPEINREVWLGLFKDLLGVELSFKD